MKKIIFIIAILVSIYNLQAQRVVEKQISVKSTATLNLKLDFADTIRIKQSKDNSIRITATVDINDNQNNDKYELIATESADYVKVMAKIHDMESIRIPCRNYRGSSYDCHGGECLTMNIYYEIEVPSIANLQIETISGDVIVENGKYPVIIKSISGIIDFSIPSNSNSDIRIETVTGGIYTNHEFNKSSDEFDGNPGGTDAIFRIGNGGTRIKLVTVSGDIFLRKY